MRQLRATVTVGSRYGSSSSVRISFWPLLMLLTVRAMIKPKNISKMTASTVKRTVFQTACWK